MANEGRLTRIYAKKEFLKVRKWDPNYLGHILQKTNQEGHMSTQPSKVATHATTTDYIIWNFCIAKDLLLILTPLIKSWAKVFDRKLSQTVLLFSPSFLSQPHISRVLHRTTLV